MAPVAVGVFFPELSLQSTDSNWTPMHNTEPPMAYKVFYFFHSFFCIRLICYLAHATQGLFRVLLHHSSHSLIHIRYKYSSPSHSARIQISNAWLYSNSSHWSKKCLVFSIYHKQCRFLHNYSVIHLSFCYSHHHHHLHLHFHPHCSFLVIIFIFSSSLTTSGHRVPD